jgi:short-subunit dehydrogenase
MRTTDPTLIDFRKKFELHDKVIVISGACGLIGRAFCEAAAQFGATVVCADIEAANPVDFAKQLESRHGRPMLGFPINVAKKNEVSILIINCNGIQKKKQFNQFLLFSIRSTYHISLGRFEMQYNFCL